MKRPNLLGTLFLVLFLVIVTSAFSTGNNSKNIHDAKTLIKKYGGNLKHELQTAMKKVGAAQAVETCHLKAPDITEEISGRSGWTIRRTSLKVRNLEDAPDKWEARVLENFERRKLAGEPIDSMDYNEIVEKDGQRTFRYMKAIPTQKVCLKCHGTEIDPSVSKQLDSLYPFDQARGFKVGDIRGAFSLSKPIERE